MGGEINSLSHCWEPRINYTSNSDVKFYSVMSSRSFWEVEDLWRERCRNL